MLELPFIGILAANAGKIRPRALGAPLEGLVVHAIPPPASNGRSVRPHRAAGGSSGYGNCSSPHAHRCAGRPVRAGCRGERPSPSRWSSGDRRAARSPPDRRSRPREECRGRRRIEFFSKIVCLFQSDIRCLTPHSAGTSAGSGGGDSASRPLRRTRDGHPDVVDHDQRADDEHAHRPSARMT